MAKNESAKDAETIIKSNEKIVKSITGVAKGIDFI